MIPVIISAVAYGILEITGVKAFDVGFTEVPSGWAAVGAGVASAAAGTIVAAARTAVRTAHKNSLLALATSPRPVSDTSDHEVLDRILTQLSSLEAAAAKVGVTTDSCAELRAIVLEKMCPREASGNEAFDNVHANETVTPSVDSPPNFRVPSL